MEFHNAIGVFFVLIGGPLLCAAVIILAYKYRGPDK